MLKHIVLNGALAGLGIIGVILLNMNGTFGDLDSQLSSGVAELIGYGAMVLFFSVFLYIGLRRYRDREAGGTLSFGRAFALGLLLVGVASVVYVTVWEAFGPADFYQQYGQQAIADIEANSELTAEARAAQVQQVQDSMAMMENPIARMLMSLMEIFPVGLLLALLAGGLLRKKGEG